MDAAASLDIDEQEDLAWAEFVLRRERRVGRSGKSRRQ
jgi:hypothetical protein